MPHEFLRILDGTRKTILQDALVSLPYLLHWNLSHQQSNILHPPVYVADHARYRGLLSPLKGNLSSVTSRHQEILMQYQRVCLEALGYTLPDEVVTTDELEHRLAPIYERLQLPHGRLELMTGIRDRKSVV